MNNSDSTYSYIFKKKCPLCNQRYDEEHISLYDCLKAMCNRISLLEDELSAVKIENTFFKSTIPPKGE